MVLVVLPQDHLALELCLELVQGMKAYSAICPTARVS